MSMVPRLLTQRERMDGAEAALKDKAVVRRSQSEESRSGEGPGEEGRVYVAGGWGGGGVQLKHLYGLIIHIRRRDKASLKFTTGNLHHMDAPNGDHRLANAISFLINGINSATLKRNDGDKNS